MTEFKRYPKSNSRQIVDYNRFIERTGTKTFVCLDKGVIGIIQVLLNSRGLWPTTYSTEWFDHGYTMPDEGQMDVVKNAIGEANLDMASCEDIVEVLQALVDKPCCPAGPGGGSAGAGIDSGNPTSQGSTPTEREGPPPAGFASWEEYDTYKCDIAYHIVNQMITDIATAGLLAAGFATGPALAGALLTAIFTPVGWAALIGLAGLAISWFILGVEVSLLTDFLEEKKDELVCAMLTGDTVANSISGFADSVNLLIPEDTEISALGAVAEYLASNYIISWASVDSFNRLYDKVAYPIETGNDCSGCSDCTPITSGITFDFGTPSHLGDGLWEVVSEAASGWACDPDSEEVAFYIIPEGFRLTEFSLESGTPATCGTDIYHAFDGLVTPYVGGESSGNAGFAVPQNLGSLYIISSSPFTVRFKLCEVPA